MANYIQLIFPRLNTSEKEILLALLANIGFEAFEEGDDYLKACIAYPGYDETTLKNTIDPNRYPFSLEIIEQQNWNAAWEKSFEPVIIGNFCAIRAVFHPPVANVQYEIVITPKMSFGTGHHATTFMVVQLMQDINFTGKKLLDFGTGTGVLAILAEKLGALDIVAIDNDEWSILNAKENIIQNNCTKIVLEQADGLHLKESFDIMLANINKNVIVDNLPLMIKHLSPGGVLILSGLLRSDFNEIVEYALKEQLVLHKHSHRGEWIALQFLNVSAA